MSEAINKIAARHSKAELVQKVLESALIVETAIDYLRPLVIDKTKMTTWEEAFYNSPSQAGIRDKKLEEARAFIEAWDASHSN